MAPPFFPEHEQVNTGEPRVVEIRMIVEEKEIEVAPGVFMWAVHLQWLGAGTDHRGA